MGGDVRDHSLVATGRSRCSTIQPHDRSTSEALLDGAGISLHPATAGLYGPRHGRDDRRESIYAVFNRLSGYQFIKPFDPSMMVHFRKRIGPDLLKVCNDMTMQNGIAILKNFETIQGPGRPAGRMHA